MTSPIPSFTMELPPAIDRALLPRWIVAAATLFSLALVATAPANAQAQATHPDRVAAAPAEVEPAKLSAEELEQLIEPIPSSDLGALEEAVRQVIELRLGGLESSLASGQVQTIVSAFRELGFLYHAHGLWPAALVCYRNAEALNPEDPSWSYASALAYKESNQIEEAASAYERSLDILPHNPAALISLAEIRLEQNQPEWAKALLRFALEVSAESPAALAVLGQVALSQKRYDKAVEILKRSLLQQPEANRLHYPLALAYRGLGDLEKAKEHLAQRGEVGVRPPDPIHAAIEERKTGERVMLLEGRRAFAVGSYEVATELFQKALDADPSSTRARVNLAAATAMTGKTQEAIDIYQEVLELEPDNAAALFNLGLLLVQNGAQEQGLPLLEKSAQADPDDAEVRLQLGRTLAGEGRLEEALKWTAESARLQPSNVSASILASDIEKAMGRWREARERLEKAYRQMPNDGLLAHALGRLLAASPDISQRDGERAVQLAGSVANAAPTPLYLETLALALGEAGRCPEASQVQELAIQKATEQGAENGIDTKEVERLRLALERYQSSPCRPPFGDGS